MLFLLVFAVSFLLIQAYPSGKYNSNSRIRGLDEISARTDIADGHSDVNRPFQDHTLINKPIEIPHLKGNTYPEKVIFLKNRPIHYHRRIGEDEFTITYKSNGIYYSDITELKSFSTEDDRKEAMRKFRNEIKANIRMGKYLADNLSKQLKAEYISGDISRKTDTPIILLQHTKGKTYASFIEQYPIKSIEEIATLAELLKIEIQRIHTMDFAHNNIGFETVLFHKNSLIERLKSKSDVRVSLINYGNAVFSLSNKEEEFYTARNKDWKDFCSFFQNILDQFKKIGIFEQRATNLYLTKYKNINGKEIAFNRPRKTEWLKDYDTEVRTKPVYMKPLETSRLWNHYGQTTEDKNLAAAIEASLLQTSLMGLISKENDVRQLLPKSNQDDTDSITDMAARSKIETKIDDNFVVVGNEELSLNSAQSKSVSPDLDEVEARYLQTVKFVEEYLASPSESKEEEVQISELCPEGVYRIQRVYDSKSPFYSLI